MAPSSISVKMPGNPGMLGLGAVAATLAMVFQVRCSGARVTEGWKVGVPRAYAEAVGKAGDGAGGYVVTSCCLVPVVTT